MPRAGHQLGRLPQEGGADSMPRVLVEGKAAPKRSAQRSCKAVHHRGKATKNDRPHRSEIADLQTYIGAAISPKGGKFFSFTTGR